MNRLRKHDIELVEEKCDHLEQLIDNRVDGNSPFYLHDELREAFPNFDLIQKLCRAYPQRVSIPKQDGSLALHIACYNENILAAGIEIVQFLVEMCPEAIKVKNRFGFLPIHKALCAAHTCEQLSVIKYLLQLFPDSIVAQNVDGCTAFHLLVSQGNLHSREFVQFFLQFNPEVVKIPDHYGQLPLHKAMTLKQSKVSAEVMKDLIAAFPLSASWKDSRGMLPLHWFLSKHISPDIDVLTILIEAYPEGLLECDHEDLTPLMRFKRLPNYNRDVEVVLLTYIEMTRDSLQEKRMLRILSKPSTSTRSKSSIERRRTVSPTKKIGNFSSGNSTKRSTPPPRSREL